MWWLVNLVTAEIRKRQKRLKPVAIACKSTMTVLVMLRMSPTTVMVNMLLMTGMTNIIR